MDEEQQSGKGWYKPVRSRAWHYFASGSIKSVCGDYIVAGPALFVWSPSYMDQRCAECLRALKGQTAGGAQQEAGK